MEGGGGDDRNGDRSASRAEVRARTLMGKTVLAVLRKLNLGQVSDDGWDVEQGREINRGGARGGCVSRDRVDDRAPSDTK